MYSFLYSTLFGKNDISDEAAKLEDLKYFVREDRELDIQIQQKFPIKFFGDPEDTLRIKGTKALVDKFNNIYAEKIDIVEKLENIEYVGLSGKNQIILNFKNDNISAMGVYDFTRDFFEELFHMGKYSNFCIKEGYNDLIKQNLDQLFQDCNYKEKQYRLIKKNDEIFIRGLTSNRYNNYDNNLALYISLLALHKFAKENDLFYYVSNAFISDSSLNIIFEQSTPIFVPNVGKVFFGAIVTNSEVRDSTLSFQIRYRVVDEKNANQSFSGIPGLISDSVFCVNHITGIERMEQKLGDLFKLKQLQDTMINYIAELNTNKTVSNDTIYFLMQRIIYSRNFKPETKKAIKKIADSKNMNHNLNIIQLFDKIDKAVTDMDEKVLLERIYHEIIKLLATNQSLYTEGNTFFSRSI